MPKVSIIIPCYNHAQYLESALASVLCQSFMDWETIVVDDGSTDDSARVAESFFAKFPKRDWKLLTRENAGLSAARNAGVAAASGEFILPLDADDMISPVYLERTIPLLEADSQLGYVYVIVDCFGEEHRTWTGGAFNFRKLLENNMMACATLFRKQAWADAGGYNSNMKHGFEDWDLWVGMGEKGWFGKLLEEPLFLYRKHGKTMLTDTYAKHEKWSRARLILNHAKLYPPHTVEKARSIVAAAEENTDRPDPPAKADKFSILMFHYEKPIDPLGVNAGAEMALIHLGRALAAKGVSVTIAGNLSCEEGTYAGVRYISTGRDYNYAGALAREAGNHSVILASARADVIDESLKYPDITTHLLLLQVDQLIVTRRPAQVINSICEGIFCVSEAQKKLMVQQGIDPSLVTILYNGADPDLFKPAEIERDAHRIAYAGALVPLKGVHNLIEAFIEVRKTYPDAILDIYGSADLWSEKEYIDSSGNDPEITGLHFHGKVPQTELAVGFSQASLSVVPSLLERPDPHPLTAMDAQSCECPVLVTPSGGLPETVEDGVTGRVLPDDSADSIKRYILEMLADPAKLREMGKAGRRRILSKFTWANAAGIVIDTVNRSSSGTKKVGSPKLTVKRESLKVGFISTFNQQCGLATYASYLLEHYDQDNLTVFAEDTQDDRIGTDAANVKRIWRRNTSDYTLLEKAIHDANIDIIHINYQPSFFRQESFYFMLKRLRQDGIKVFTTMHVLDEEIKEYVLLAQSVDGVMFHLPYLKMQWNQVGGNPDNVFIIPHGIPRLPVKPKEEVRQSLEIPQDHQLYVTFGFVEPHKGIIDNIRNLPILKGQYPFLYVVLGGAHPRNIRGQEYIEKCQDLVTRLGLEENVQFMTGFLPDEHIYVMLKAADAIIMNYQSNRYEASGATALALAAGSPIVASNAPPFSDLGNAVMRITEKFHLAKILFDLRRNNELRETLLQESAKIAAERSWANTAKKVQEAYGKVLHR